jgi:hypothetical protein
VTARSVDHQPRLGQNGQQRTVVEAVAELFGAFESAVALLTVAVLLTIVAAL